MTPRLLYTLLLWLLLPYVFFHLLWRGRKQPEYFQHIGERFGFFSAKSTKTVIWLHTVSVGETRAAATLIQRLSEQYPDHQILLTHTTPTGRTTSEQLYGDRVIRAYLPYDYPFAVRLFLRHFQPTLGMLLETEIWFNLIHECKKTGTSLLLLNARLSEKSRKRYSRFPNLTRLGLNELTTISAQTNDDAERLQTLGAAQVEVMGNLKFDISPPEHMLELGHTLRKHFGENRPVFLAASTREGEEVPILEALKQAPIPGLLTIIVPRHPQRFDEVASLIEKHGFHMQRRSERLAILDETEIVLGDSMGEMFAYYTACDIAFIGGSLLPFGSQNLIEACAVGKPVLIGPHTYNFAQASELAIQCGAAKQISNATELMNSVADLFAQPEKISQMGAAGIGFTKSNQGATERALTIVSKTLNSRQTLN